jgi:drug/metabolite transporter (DMT)-like permease
MSSSLLKSEVPTTRMTDPSAPNSSDGTLGLLVVLAAATSISFSNILAPIVLDLGSSTPTLLVFRFGCFLAVCGLWLNFRNISFALERGDLAHCAGAGLANTVGSGSLVAAFAFMPVSLVVLIFYTFPLLTRLAECALDRRRPAPFEIACLLAALVGLAICLGIGFGRLNAPGLFFSVLAALGVAGSFLWAGRKLKAVQPTLQTFYMAGTGLLIALVVTFTTDSWALPPFELIAVALMAAAALSFAAAFLGMFAGVQMIGPSRTAMIMNLEPILTVAMAILLLDEDLSPNQFLGAALVIAAIFASQIRPPIR